MALIRLFDVQIKNVLNHPADRMSETGVHKELPSTLERLNNNIATKKLRKPEITYMIQKLVQDMAQSSVPIG